ncbi:MAG TPA: response regulator transcription factor [Pyrinomonadaceae bacterium]|nr:response regulator transcription factor [Pyrinomonadaceae bacterium]
MTDHKLRVMSVDDHPLLHEGIAALINNQTDMMLIAEATTAAEAPALFRESKPDVVLMDLRLADGSGIDAMTAILSEFPAARVVILTMAEGDADIRQALKAGARGYVLKSMPPKELLHVIRSVHAGKKHIHPQIASQLAEYFADDALTAREIQVLSLVAEGCRNRDIAEKLFISEETVKVHIKHIMEKLTASDRTQAVAIGLRRGIIHL